MPPSSARCFLVTVLASVACALSLNAIPVVVAEEEPKQPVCRSIAKDSLAFCSMVDYVAVVDADDPAGQRFDVQAEFYYKNVDTLLRRFGCHAKYSVYGCDDCREAYKYWICSVKFQKCGSQVVTISGQDENVMQYYPQRCDALAPSSAAVETTASASSLSSSASTSASGAEAFALPCVEGSTGRYRTCLSICEDVVRKCPYVLNFQCPTSETVFFSSDITVCNKQDRVTNPDKPSLAWPGTFAGV